MGGLIKDIQEIRVHTTAQWEEMLLLGAGITTNVFKPALDFAWYSRKPLSIMSSIRSNSRASVVLI